MRAFSSVLLLIAFLLFVGGCGGGTASTPPPTATPKLTIGWGTRSRVTGNLNSALSVQMRLQGARSDGSDLVVSANRTGNLAAYTQTVTSPEVIRLGTRRLTVTFFSEINQEGAVVGTADSMVELPQNGQLPDVSVVATVQKVDIEPDQLVLVGQKTDLVFTARDVNNTLVPVSQGSVAFTKTNGADRLRFVNGQAEGMLPGTSTVVAQIDGISSTPTSVAVRSLAEVTISPNPASVIAGQTIQMTAQVSTTTEQGVTWSVQEGATGGRIDAEGNYTAPATPGNYHVVAVSRYDPEKSAIALINVTPAPVRTTFYIQDFESGIGSEWSSTTTDVTPNGGRRFLGQFGTDESVTLSLNGLPEHSTIEVSFDLFVLRTWDGNDTVYGPDRWQFTCDGTTLLNTTFSNWDKGDHVFRQAYPGVAGIGDNPARIGAVENNTLGFALAIPIYPGNIQDSVYHFTFTQPHHNRNVEFRFIGAGNYGGGFLDEGWGIDNVTVVTY